MATRSTRQLLIIVLAFLVAGICCYVFFYALPTKYMSRYNNSTTDDSSTDDSSTGDYGMEMDTSSVGGEPNQKYGPVPVTEKSRLVYYGTDRNWERKLNGVDQYGKFRRKPNANLSHHERFEPISYGVAVVNIPPHHTIGELEAPSLRKLEFANDVSKHVFITKTRVMNKNEFFNQVNAASSQGGKSALAFVHGYNVTFEDAIRRTAQIANDIHFNGPALAFSWPSQGGVIPYTIDGTNITKSARLIEQFLEKTLDCSKVERLYVLAHSMGSQGVTSAIISLVQRRPAFASRIQEIILAAPDIDGGLFRETIAPKLVKCGKRVTVYSSSKDLALKMSKRVNGYQRAGDSSPYIITIAGIESIDASNIDTSLLGHSYIAEERPLIDDLFMLIRHRMGAAQRPLKKSANNKYWMFER